MVWVHTAIYSPNSPTWARRTANDCRYSPRTSASISTGRSLIAGRALDSQLLDPVHQRCPFHAESRGSAISTPDDPLACLECTNDMIALHQRQAMQHHRGLLARRQRLQFPNWGPKHAARRENDGPLDEVLQFPHVAWPGIPDQCLQRLHRNVVDVFVHAHGVVSREMAHKPWNVVRALPERR